MRLAYIDNLRCAMILLVISMHAADTYSPLGNWYFVDRRPISTATLLTFAAWQMYLQSFFMGLLFFVAGFFVPPSFDRKGASRFLRDRAVRLGIPVLLYMFCIGPVTEYYFAHSWTSTLPTSFPNEWIKHIRNGEFLQENGPLWFCLALLIFSSVYVIVRELRSASSNDHSKTSPPGTLTLLGFAFAMAVATFLVRAGRPSPVLNLHLGDFPQYVLLFVAGIAASRFAWLPEFSSARGIRCIVIALTAGFAVWFALLLYGGALDGKANIYSGGWHWQSAAYCLWESLTCVALSYGLLTLFRDKLNSQRRIGRFLSENAFSVYVFHPPVVIALARAFTGLQWYPLVMFLMLTITSAAVTFALSASVFRRIPLLRSVL